MKIMLESNSVLFAMRARRLRQPILIIVHIITLLACLGALALAQAPSPTPPPAPASPTGSAWADMISALIGHAGALIPLLQNELEGPLLPWLERLSWGLAAVVFTFTFARMWRESSGAGADLFWWFGRAVICLALMGSGPALISRLDAIGQSIAWGGSDGRSSVLYRFYDNQRKSLRRVLAMGQRRTEEYGVGERSEERNCKSASDTYRIDEGDKIPATSMRRSLRSEPARSSTMDMSERYLICFAGNGSRRCVIWAFSARTPLLSSLFSARV